MRVPSSWRWMIKPNEPFQPYDMFGYPAAWNDAQSGLLGRTFTVEPQGDARVWLVFEGILQEWVIFVNGVRVAEGSEGFLPIEVDVTAHVRPGEANALAVWCGAWRSADDRDRPQAARAGRLVVRPAGARHLAGRVPRNPAAGCRGGCLRPDLGAPR